MELEPRYTVKAGGADTVEAGHVYSATGLQKILFKIKEDGNFYSHPILQLKDIVMDSLRKLGLTDLDFSQVTFITAFYYGDIAREIEKIINYLGDKDRHLHQEIIETIQRALDIYRFEIKLRNICSALSLITLASSLSETREHRSIRELFDEILSRDLDIWKYYNEAYGDRDTVTMQCIYYSLHRIPQLGKQLDRESFLDEYKDAGADNRLLKTLHGVRNTFWFRAMHFMNNYRV